MVRPLDDDELQSSVHQKEHQDFDQSVFTHLGPAATVDDFEAKDLTPHPAYFDDTHIIDPDYGDAEITPEMGDNYLTAELVLPRGGTMVKDCVSARKRDRDGIPVGLANSNPILDTCSYIIDFNDGDQTELTANLIAESLFSQCDPDRNQYVLLDEIVDHRHLPMAIQLTDQKVVCTNNRTYLKRSTIGWQICCQWKDGSLSWENLSELKESHPIETSEYAKIIGVGHEPAFNWWVPYVLKKRGPDYLACEEAKSTMSKKDPQIWH